MLVFERQAAAGDNSGKVGGQRCKGGGFGGGGGGCGEACKLTQDTAQ